MAINEETRREYSSTSHGQFFLQQHMEESTAKTSADILCRFGHFYQPIILALSLSKNCKLSLGEPAAELPG